VLFLNWADAVPRGIANGDRVRMFNGRGSCILVAEVDGEVRSGVVSAPSVRWNKSAPDGSGINALTSDRLTDLGGGPTFYSCLVEVEKCGD
jgi:anaerobic selenocysteine-containing dehydrogenase